MNLLSVKRTVSVFFLLVIPGLLLPAQTAGTAPAVFDTSGFPQWAKDLRRWEIVTFGSFPFTMFTATFAMDMYRWSQANGMDFSDVGRQYAPWPLKSAGAKAMEGKEVEHTITIAAGLSVAVAFADLIIVQIKRYKARKRIEALPVGTTIITRTAWGEETHDEEPENGESGGGELIPAEPEPPSSPLP
ncbi:MAG: hypothetical protein FWH38_04545 [Treponema sp.]|nr:hypothetical protein [Treponema sp.]